MENGLPNELLLVGFMLGVILLLVGGFSMKSGSGGWNLIDLLLNRQGSGFGQFVSGLLLIAGVIAMFLMKRNGII